MRMREAIHDILTIAKYNLKIETRYPLSYIGSFLNLLFWILSFGVLAMIFGGDSTKANIVGNMILWSIFGFLMFQVIISEVGFGIIRLQRRGTLEQIFLAPIKEWTLPLGLALYSLVISLLFGILTIIFIKLFLGVSIIVKNILLGIFNFVMFFIMCYGSALLFGGLMLKLKRVGWSFVNFIMFIVMIFGGIFYPFKSLPEAVLHVSRILPYSYGIDAFRTSLIGMDPELIPRKVYIFGIVLSARIFEEILVICLSFGLLIIGYLYYTKCIRDAKKKGYLGTY